MTGPGGRVKRFKRHTAGGVGSGQEVFNMPRVGLGRARTFSGMTRRARPS